MVEMTDSLARDVLTQEEAETRAAHINNVRYELSLDLAGGASSYRGEAVLYFDFRGPGDTFLDFRGKRIERLEINGEVIEPVWSRCRIMLPGKLLAAQTRV